MRVVCCYCTVDHVFIQRSACIAYWVPTQLHATYKPPFFVHTPHMPTLLLRASVHSDFEKENPQLLSRQTHRHTHIWSHRCKKSLFAFFFILVKFVRISRLKILWTYFYYKNVSTGETQNSNFVIFCIVFCVIWNRLVVRHRSTHSNAERYVILHRQMTCVLSRFKTFFLISDVSLHLCRIDHPTWTNKVAR